jgi:branched-chain amino acid transport system substrate-binding protein
MAVEDFGGKVLGKRIEVISADHQNKPDIGASIAGAGSIWSRWMRSLTFRCPRSPSRCRRYRVRRSRLAYFVFGASDLTGKSCSPVSVHWTYDTYALSCRRQCASEARRRSWFFVTADYAFGLALEKDAVAVVEAGGGKVIGSVRHPQDTSDFSSFLLRAQSSNAKVIALANAGGDTVTAIKQAKEFDITKKQQIVGLLTYISDVHSLGLQNAQGLLLASAFARDGSRGPLRFAARVGKARDGRRRIRRGASLSQRNRAAKTDEAKAAVSDEGAADQRLLHENGSVREDGRVMCNSICSRSRSPVVEAQV